MEKIRKRSQALATGCADGHVRFFGSGHLPGEATTNTRIIRISGPCVNTSVRCAGFAIAEDRVFRDHLACLTQGETLTQGQLLEYGGLVCLECKLGPGWHIPQRGDPYHISTVGTRRQSMQLKVEQMEKMLADDHNWSLTSSAAKSLRPVISSLHLNKQQQNMKHH